MNTPNVARAKFKILELLLHLRDYEYNFLQFSNLASEWSISYQDIRAAAIILCQQQFIEVARYEPQGGKYPIYSGSDEHAFFAVQNVMAKALPQGRAGIHAIKNDYLDAARSDFLAARQQFEYWHSNGRCQPGSQRWDESESRYRAAKDYYEIVRDEVGGDPRVASEAAMAHTSRDLHPLARSIVELKFTLANALAKANAKQIFAHSFKNEVNILRIQQTAETREDLQIYLQALYELFFEGSTFSEGLPAAIHQISRLRVDVSHDFEKGSNAVAKQIEVGEIYMALIGKNTPTQIDEYQEVQWALLKAIEAFLSNAVNDAIQGVSKRI